jgi:enterochelin esterase-like enzyme
MEAHAPTQAPSPGRRLVALAAPAVGFLLFLSVGFVGLYRYLDSFWLYRGFPPPRDPAFVKQAGTIQTIQVTSPAIGGRSERVEVYLPPGYDPTAAQRYPVLYLLHGFPGNPDGFVRTVRVGVVEDTLLAEKKMKPTILAMPMGSTGIGRDQKWETFLERDVVRAIDGNFNTIRSGAGRGLAGLSEGGYAAFNIGLHHPARFHVLESWSGYETADDIKSIFGGRRKLLEHNSPSSTLPKAAPQLRREHAYAWFYSGTNDGLRKQNVRFAAELRRLRIRYHFFLAPGGHNWAVWRTNAWQAIEVASAHLAHG